MTTTTHRPSLPGFDSAIDTHLPRPILTSNPEYRKPPIVTTSELPSRPASLKPAVRVVPAPTIDVNFAGPEVLGGGAPITMPKATSEEAEASVRGNFTPAAGGMLSEEAKRWFPLGPTAGPYRTFGQMEKARVRAEMREREKEAAARIAAAGEGKRKWRVLGSGGKRDGATMGKMVETRMKKSLVAKEKTAAAGPSGASS